jgi:peptide/nickel transport system permease protein
MVAYLIRRLLWSIVMLILVISIVFLIFFILPGGAGKGDAGGGCPVCIQFAGKNPRPAQIELVKERFGLDKPLYQQYLNYIGNAVQGDLGRSFQTQEEVTDAIFHRLPATAGLAFGASIVWLLMGVSIGVVSALKRRTLIDRGSMLLALLGVSLPTFVIGLFGIFLFDGKLNIYDTGSYVPITENPIQWFKVMWLPWLVLAVVSAAIYARIVRGNMLEVSGEDYIRTARAKGLPERSVTRHKLRSALTPIVTLYGLDLGILLGGAVITEAVFNIPGIGSYSVQAIQSSNLPIILGTTTFAAAFVIIANLLVDVAYAALDPRVRYS